MIVGLLGKKGSGKTTAAEMLVEQGFDRLSFATTLKKMARVLLEDLGCSEETIEKAIVTDREAIIPELGVSGRHVMQTLGTDWGRKLINPNVWIMTTEEQIRRITEDGREPRVVFDDVRFDNEADMIINLGGELLKLNRDSAEEAPDDHDSEKGLSDRFNDVVEEIDNNGDIYELSGNITSILYPL